LGDFIEMPFKNYSSGMQARLGFACVAAVDPDVLLIDEVLSVGDANFSRKCLARIQELQKNGTTLVLVSHDPSTVSNFCTQGFVFEAGNLVFEGPIHDALDVHEQILARRDNRTITEATLQEARRQRQLVADEHLRQAGLAATDTPKVQVALHLLQPKESSHAGRIDLQKPFDLRFEARVVDGQLFEDDISVGIGIMTEAGTRVGGLNNLQSGVHIPLDQFRKSNQISVIFRFRGGLPDLAAGVYKILFGIHDQQISRSIHLEEFGPFVFSNHTDGVGSRGDILRLLDKDIGIEFEIRS
jgi:hypothetical protein